MKNKIDTEELSDALESLEKYISFIFDNEISFIKEICSWASIEIELINVSFTSESCKIVYMLDYGQHVCDTIDVKLVIDWIDGIIKI